METGEFIYKYRQGGGNRAVIGRGGGGVNIHTHTHALVFPLNIGFDDISHALCSNRYFANQVFSVPVLTVHWQIY